ncbi:fluoride efflux transporter FluC [Prochlorococcus marinus]|uniref:fluoride efflux transporter FluC n=1 Tax=Prochlorococcus marinus TaxID=1219 RepID=UPI0039AFE5F5
MANLDTFQHILLVSIGAVFGVNFRFIIYQKLKEININRYFIILAINTFSCFLLGLFTSILPKMKSLTFSSQLAFFVLIGFLGSLSTFSTFVYDLFDLFLKSKFFKALKLFSFSFSLGIFALALGSSLGN